MVRGLGALVFLGLVGCSGDSFKDGGSDDYGFYSDYGSPDTATTPGATEGQGDVGELTAGAWDDNENFDYFLDYLQEFGQLEGQPALTAQERSAAHEAFSADREANVDLDVALLIDTTGSMSDELSYLTTEIQSIAAAIEAEAPDAGVRFALVVYRDNGDDYVTGTFGFTGDIGDFQSELGQHFAAGGGDYPEASPEGLAALNQLGWRSDPAVARMAFWITDAPHHPTKAGELTDALRVASDQDVHLYPVAASGVDELAELTMRSGAQLTGGRYLFLTDDSGIGDTHKEPTIPCYFVTTLRNAMVRMAEMELTGDYIEPAPEQVIRTGGDPQDRRCSLDDGTTVTAF